VTGQLERVIEAERQKAKRASPARQRAAVNVEDRGQVVNCSARLNVSWATLPCNHAIGRTPTATHLAHAPRIWLW
jgi:hypothetical protein